MTNTFADQPPIQYFLGLLIGFVFGFLLQKGGVCNYEVILGQLLLTDFTVIKVILTAIITGMIGVYGMRQAGWVKLHKKSGSAGATIPGPLIFGVGFALLGYCPGTSFGAVGHGAMDALVGGVIGITMGTALYAAVYPIINKKVLHFGTFGDITLIELLGVKNVWVVIFPLAVAFTAFLYFLERSGF